jgi:hypothetical protein
MRIVTVTLVIERPRLDSPAFVIVPAKAVARWKLAETTTVDAVLDDHPCGRRSLKRFDEVGWFLELPRGALEAIGKKPGNRARLAITRASTALPAELERLIATDAAARERWEKSTDAQKRMLREEILTRKSSEARERCARRALLPRARPRTQPLAGLKGGRREIIVRIIATRLPGRSCGHYSDLAVGLVEKVGCAPKELTPADAREVRWETTIEVRAGDGAPAFRGRAVNGPPHERFLYLTWIGRVGGAAPAMFRRAKLRLDAVPVAVLEDSLESGLLVGRLELTARDGMPVAASVRPPAITWSSGG